MEMLGADRLAFPVVVISADGFVYMAVTSERLQRCNAVALRKGLFVAARVLDASGRLHRVTAVGSPRVVKGGLLRLIGNPVLRLELQLEHMETLSVEAARGTLQTLVETHPEFWVAVEDVEDVLARLDGAASLPELFGVFAGRARE
jgi:hypothetical protein